MKSSTTKASFTPHGGGIRGADVRRQSSLFEGRFGRMFRELPAAIHPKPALLKLGEAMTADAEGVNDTPPKPRLRLKQPHIFRMTKKTPASMRATHTWGNSSTTTSPLIRRRA